MSGGLSDVALKHKHTHTHKTLRTFHVTVEMSFRDAAAEVEWSQVALIPILAVFLE